MNPKILEALKHLTINLEKHLGGSVIWNLYGFSYRNLFFKIGFNFVDITANEGYRMNKKNIFLIYSLLISLLVTHESQATMTVYGANPPRHDRFYMGSDKDFLVGSHDTSGIGKVVSSSSKWATMISNRFFVSANHSHPSVGEAVRFYYSNDPADGYVDRIVAGGQQVPNNSGGIDGDLWLGYFSNSVPSNIAKYPLLGSGLSKPSVGSKLIMFGKANNSSIANDNPLNQRVGRNICASNSSYTYSFTYSTPGTPDSLGIDETLSQQGDSGAPSFVLVDNRLALVGTRWTTTSDMSIISRSQSLNNLISSLSSNSESLTFLDIPTAPSTPLMLENFENEALDSVVTR